MWVMWYIKFMSDQNYYCVYPWIPSRQALVAKWNDADARAGKLYADSKLVENWDQNLVAWPSYIPSLDWNGHDKLIQPQVMKQRLSCDDQRSRLNLPKLQTAMQGMPRDIVILHFINSAFMPFMLSWLCNTQQMTGVHERTLVVTTDRGSEERVRTFSTRVHTMFLEGYNNINGDLDFDSLGYRRMLKARIEIITSVLEKSDLLFLTEPDAIWITNLLEIKDFVGSQADLTGFDDELGGKGAGFVLMRNNAAISCLWRKLLQKQELTLAPYQGQPNEIVTYDDNDQKYFNALIQDMEAAGMLRSATMDTCRFRTGKWYRREEWKDYFACMNVVPDIVNFNWMVGNQAKIQRAKLFGHWFLEEDGQTCKPIDQTLVRARASFTGGAGAMPQAAAAPPVPAPLPFPQAMPNMFVPPQPNFPGAQSPVNPVVPVNQFLLSSRMQQQGILLNNAYSKFRVNPAVNQRINNLLAERFRRVGKIRHAVK
uniref:Nucleotide-diphospho-sugar transferase domain-containing protein n=1 Tax=Hanusia phi TaxID=3032 RepID=A0A7S0ES03_9CRYP